MANVFKPDFDEPRDHEGFRAKRARVGRQLGTQSLGASAWELPPGEAAYPYHAHLGDEELVIVLSGPHEPADSGGLARARGRGGRVLRSR